MRNKKPLYVIFTCIVAFVIYTCLFDAPYDRSPSNRTNLISNQTGVNTFDESLHDEDDEISDSHDSLNNEEKTKSRPIQLELGDRLIFKKDTAYLILFDFSMKVEPQNDKRRQLITKYESQSKPPKGWAIALRKTVSSTRMEFYLNDGTTALSWLTFSALDIPLNQNNTYAFVIKPGDFISLYKISMGETGRLEQLGVYSLGLINDIQSSSNLQITSGATQTNKFRSHIDNIKILEFTEFPKTKKEFNKILEKGNDRILENKNLKCLISIPSLSSPCELNQ